MSSEGFEVALPVDTLIYVRSVLERLVDGVVPRMAPIQNDEDRADIAATIGMLVADWSQMHMAEMPVPTELNHDNVSDMVNDAIARHPIVWKAIASTFMREGDMVASMDRLDTQGQEMFAVAEMTVRAVIEQTPDAALPPAHMLRNLDKQGSVRFEQN